VTHFKVTPDKTASHQRQAGLYQGQIWGCKFARQLILRMGRGELSLIETQRLIREAILRLEAEAERLPTDACSTPQSSS
jgi:hypothetical protein